MNIIENILWFSFQPVRKNISEYAVENDITLLAISENILWFSFQLVKKNILEYVAENDITPLAISQI